jgi:energy-coupling factor transporter ATP-binding protein EcfA2
LDRAVWVRRVLPFLAALQGQVTLHASAVASTTGVYAFVGASGAGKSTLAGCLARLGWRPISDDLLPCRRREGGVIVPIGEDQALPLRAIYFLSRQDSLECVRRMLLNRAGCFKRLLAHGFGEIGLKNAWAAQFELYGSMANAIPAYDLVEPDALPCLDRSALEISAMLAEQTSQSASNFVGG